MDAIRATWKDGQVVLEGQTDWPEGSRLLVVTDRSATEELTIDEEQGDDPEAIARWLAAFDAIPPVQMAPEEEAAWQAARQEQRDIELAAFAEHADKLRRLFE